MELAECQQATTASTRERRFEKFSRWSEIPMGLLALGVIPLLLVEARTADPAIRRLAIDVNWSIWLAFCGEFLIKLALAPQRMRYLRGAWPDLAIIVLSPPFLVPEEMDAVRALRAVRLARLLRVLRVARVLMLATIGLRLARRLFRHHGFHYVVVVATVTVGAGALAVYHLEQGINPAVRSVGDALWWAVVTTTTVGYGDVSPVTGEGRLVAVLLMLVGIAVIGVFTATLSSFFFEKERESEHARLEKRLQTIEGKLDELLKH